MAPYAIHTYPPSLIIVSMNPLPAPNPTQARKSEIPISRTIKLALMVV